MRYDEEKISWIVSDKRKSFWHRAGFIISLMLISLVVCIINISDYLTVLFAFFEFPLMFLLARVIRKFNAKVLLGKRIEGKNIKEYEYAIHGERKDRIYRRGNMPHTFTNNKILPLRLNGTVYLELENGNITSISGLYKVHMDIYEDKDVLVRYAGTKFPIIVSRDVDRQPCPICGEVNDRSLDECRVCGLGILKSRK